MRKINISKEVLYQKYVIEKKTSTQIGEEFNTKGSVIIKKLRKYGIQVRSKSESHKGVNSCNIPKDILYKKYITEKKSSYKIAEELNYGVTFV